MTRHGLTLRVAFRPETPVSCEDIARMPDTLACQYEMRPLRNSGGLAFFQIVRLKS
jgi:hypothetical protein